VDIPLTLTIRHLLDNIFTGCRPVHRVETSTLVQHCHGMGLCPIFPGHLILYRGCRPALISAALPRIGVVPHFPWPSDSPIGVVDLRLSAQHLPRIGPTCDDDDDYPRKRNAQAALFVFVLLCLCLFCFPLFLPVVVWFSTNFFHFPWFFL
jgi:hypothetical protein